MDSMKFKALTTAVKLGSLTNAASSLGYTQAGLTHMMNRLEHEIGFSLLKRDKYGVHLTDEGEKLMPHIENFLNAADDLEYEIEALREHRIHTIKIASYSSIISYWLPSVIKEFKRNHPNVTIEISDESADDIYPLVTEGKADLGFVSKREDSGCCWIHLKNDPLVAVVPSDYDVSIHDGRMKITDFGGAQFLMPSMGFDYDIMNVLNKYNVKPRITRTSVSDSAVISMVAHGLGLSIMSELIVCENAQDVRILGLYPDEYRDLGIIYTQNASRTAKEFAECAKKYIAED
ncbi:MAG: LysR family transcriptional regulator [Acutalibacteraceae bacterium]|nr:LysR family transcriptional regulator [Oscillospiraceae bacterium]